MSGFDKIRNMDISSLERPGEKKDPDRDLEEAAVDEATAEEDTVDETAVEEAAAEDLPAEETDAAEIVPGEADAEKTGAEAKEEQEMMEPQGTHYYLDADFTEKDMISFVAAHSYRQPFMIVMTILGIACPIYALATHRGNNFFSIACLFIFLIYFPVTTYLRGKGSIVNNPAYQETFHYMLDEWGLHLKIQKDAVDVAWDRVIKSVFLKEIVVLYTGKNNAFLIPYRAMKDQKEEITAFIKARGKLQ